MPRKLKNPRIQEALTSGDAQLREAGRLYLEGKVEISQLARMMSADPSDIAAAFEQRGLVRSLSTIQLSDEDRQRRLLLNLWSGLELPA